MNTFFSRQIIQSLFPIPDSPLGSTIPLIIAGLFGVPGQMAVHGLLRRWDVRQVQRLVWVHVDWDIGFRDDGCSLRSRCLRHPGEGRFAHIAVRSVRLVAVCVEEHVDTTGPFSFQPADPDPQPTFCRLSALTIAISLYVMGCVPVWGRSEGRWARLCFPF